MGERNDLTRRITYAAYPSERTPTLGAYRRRVSIRLVRYYRTKLTSTAMISGAAVASTAPLDAAGVATGAVMIRRYDTHTAQCTTF